MEELDYIWNLDLSWKVNIRISFRFCWFFQTIHFTYHSVAVNSSSPAMQSLISVVSGTIIFSGTTREAFARTHSIYDDTSICNKHNRFRQQKIKMQACKRGNYRDNYRIGRTKSLEATSEASWRKNRHLSHKPEVTNSAFLTYPRSQWMTGARKQRFSRQRRQSFGLHHRRHSRRH